MSSVYPYQTHRLIVKTTTWTRDSHGLFDFDAKYTMESVIRCSEAGHICRVSDRCTLQPELSETSLLLVSPIGKDEWEVRGCASNKLWVVVKTLSYKESKGHLLSEGDSIKLGRELFKIRQISVDGAAQPQLPNIDDCYSEPATPSE
jgi:hypothetical protein